MTEGDGEMHLLLATYNGAAYLPAQLASLVAQTHAHWRLWVRDDGSVDGTDEVLREWVGRDERMEFIGGEYGGGEGGGGEGQPLGAAGSFARLWERAPIGARYLGFVDQDDVWVPEKLERSLAALREAERVHGDTTPILVHSDLAVVDAALRPVASSFRAYAGLGALEAPLAERVAHNVVTGCTVLVNRALREAAGPIPDGVMHDAWLACVATAVGRTVYLPEPLVAYRQHGANAIGARGAPAPLSRAMWRALFPWRARQAVVRRHVADAARLAQALLPRLAGHLPPHTMQQLLDMATIPHLPFLARKVALWQCMRVPSRGWLHHLGLVLRG